MLPWMLMKRCMLPWRSYRNMQGVTTGSHNDLGHYNNTHFNDFDCKFVKDPMSKWVLRGLALLWLALLPGRMDRDKSTYNHWYLIAHTRKFVALQVVASDEDTCDQNGNPSTLPSLTSSTHHYYFHALLILSKDLTLFCVLFFTRNTICPSSFCQPVFAYLVFGA